AILIHYGFLSTYAFDPDLIFRNHIMTGIMVSFSAYLSARFCHQSSNAKKIAYAALFLLFSYHLLFVNTGRTGYIIYFLLFFIFLIQTCRWQQILISLAALFIFLPSTYFSSHVIQSRVADSVTQLKDYKHDQKNTEIGFRLQFHTFAYQLFKKHPVLGNGTGSFTYSFSKENPVPFWTKLKGRLLEPHSQYWFIASELGLLGLTIFMLFFVTLLRASLQLNHMKPIACALIIIFLVGNLSDSLLFFSGTGYLFLLIMALCLGEKKI
ncbi:MAG: O-antigen ligase family protein, partial [Legionella sp.]|nr:O-antigen ligase family protein [Legionella sp.]